MIINGIDVEVEANWRPQTDWGYKIRTEGYTAPLEIEAEDLGYLEENLINIGEVVVRSGKLKLSNVLPASGTPISNFAVGGYIYANIQDHTYRGFGICLRYKSWLNQTSGTGSYSNECKAYIGGNEQQVTYSSSSVYNSNTEYSSYIFGADSTEIILVDSMKIYWNCDAFPIFETVEDLDDYLADPNNSEKYSKAINYLNSEDIEDTEYDYEILNGYGTATWSSYGPSDSDIDGYRNVRFKMSRGHKICLYPVGGFNVIVNGAIKYKLVYRGMFEAISYSTDGENYIDTNTMPWTEFYRKRDRELGTFTYGVQFYNGKIPIFKNPVAAQDYIDGLIPITEAENWPIISPQYPIVNDSGDDDPDTDFGDVYTKSFFTQQWLCTEATVQEISNKLYDITQGGFWEDIKKGIEMFGDNPIESVVNLTYYPIDLSTVFTNTAGAGHSVWFGGYELELENSTADKILYPDGFFSCGSVFIQRSFNNYRDMPPYTRLWVDLPYCGRYELDPTKYMNKWVEVRYYIDTRTGGCNCCLVTSDAGIGGHLSDSFNGQIGTQLTVRMTDFTAYANAQINTLLGNGGQAVNTSLDVSKAGAQAGMSGSAIGVVGAGVGAAALGSIQGAKTVYGLAMNNINKFNQTRGGSSAMLNQYLNQTPCFTLEILEMDIPSNYYNMVGGPSNAGGNIGSFSGYLECDQIRLNVTGATETEKEKIRSLLMGGVYL